MTDRKGRQRPPTVTIPEAEAVARKAADGSEPSVVTQPGMRPAEAHGLKGPQAPAQLRKAGSVPKAVIGKPRAEAQPPSAQDPAGDDPPSPGGTPAAVQRARAQAAAAAQRAASPPAASAAASDDEVVAERPRLLPVPPPSARRERAGVTTPAALDHWQQGIRALAPTNAEVPVIQVLEAVGEDFWTGGGVTAKAVQQQLRAIGQGDVEVYVNSPGGDMFEGFAIYNLLVNHPGRITVKVLGLAASAASVIAMAGDEVLMGDAAFLMIHDAQVLAMGNWLDLRETSDWLRPFDRAMADVYSARTKQTKTKCLDWMDANGGEGTYFSAAEAIRWGFADGRIPAGQIVEDAQATADGRGKSSLLKAELALCAHYSRSQARAILNEIKGTAKPDAGGVREGAGGNGSPSAAAAKPDAGGTDPELAALLASMTQMFKS